MVFMRFYPRVEVDGNVGFPPFLCTTLLLGDRRTRYMPVTGIPLPLMSYGGSSVLFTFLALGIVMNIRMRRFVN